MSVHVVGRDVCSRVLVQCRVLLSGPKCHRYATDIVPVVVYIGSMSGVFIYLSTFYLHTPDMPPILHRYATDIELGSILGRLSVGRICLSECCKLGTSHD
jgi:hypothetical protein